MKNRLFKYILSLLILSFMAVSLVACKKPQPIAEDTETDSEDAAAKDSKSASDNSSETEKLKEKYMEYYEAFLADERPVVIADDYSNGMPVFYLYYSQNSDNQPIMEPNTPFLLSDFIETFFAKMSTYYNMPITPKAVSYAYIDCGNDGLPELALEISDDNYSTTLFVIKATDSGLEFRFTEDWHSRTYGEINELGYFIYSAPNGGASYEEDNFLLDAEVNKLFVKGTESILSPAVLYIHDNDQYMDIVEKENLYDSISIYRTYFDFYNYEEDYKHYNEYLSTCLWTYEGLKANGEPITDGSDHKDGSVFKKFWDSTGLPLYTQEEIDKLVLEHELKMGATKQVKNAPLAEFAPVSGYTMGDEAIEESPDMFTEFFIENSGWQYYLSENAKAPSEKILTLSKISEKPNDIVNTSEWFNDLGLSMPERTYFENDDYYFFLQDMDGDQDGYMPYILDIQPNRGTEHFHRLDFSAYVMPETYASEKKDFVDETIFFADIKDNVLYVCTSHRTYASFAPQNAYITALDMDNNYNVLWKTEPLTCNSDNFIIMDDHIICGYGFTAEDDYIYVLDRNTGKRTQKYKVKSSPNYFVIKDNKLYVNTYNTDYVFDISVK